MRTFHRVLIVTETRATLIVSTLGAAGVTIGSGKSAYNVDTCEAACAGDAEAIFVARERDAHAWLLARSIGAVAP